LIHTMEYGSCQLPYLRFLLHPFKLTLYSGFIGSTVPP
jgi:hypothetical protein